MENQKLTFGRFKGKLVNETPTWYQTWLKAQPWFNKPKKQVSALPLDKQLNGWDGHGRKGQAIYDAIFEEEKRQGDKEYERIAWMYGEGEI